MTAEEALAKRERRVVRLMKMYHAERVLFLTQSLRHAEVGLAKGITDGLAREQRMRSADIAWLTKKQKLERAIKRAPAGDVAEARRRLGLP